MVKVTVQVFSVDGLEGSDAVPSGTKSLYVKVKAPIASGEFQTSSYV